MSTNTKGKAAAAAKPATQNNQVSVVTPPPTPAAGAETPGSAVEGAENSPVPGGVDQAGGSIELQGAGELQGDSVVEIAPQGERQIGSGDTDAFKSDRPFDDEKLYTVKSVLIHDDEPYAPGQHIWLTDKVAEPLLKIDAISWD